MPSFVKTVLFLFSCLPAFVSSGEAQDRKDFGFDFSGKARVIDGDTLYIGSVKVRIFGIDAPEAGQTCTHEGKSWNCGQEATFALTYMVSPHWIECKKRGSAGPGVVLATCYTGPYDVAAKMVSEGWALSLRSASLDYADEETAARRARKGVWRGTVVPPWVRRTQHP
ncbi:MAG: thermonuclease family protein [Rhodospirillales bacterium]